MPQSLVKNYIHITFSTKDRYPFIDDSVENELFCYIGGTCKELECAPIRVGGYKDHIHILCLLSRKIALMKLIEELKVESSKWIKLKGRAYKKFLNQKHHHLNKSFKDEFRAFLKKYQVEYDEKYMWD